MNNLEYLFAANVFMWGGIFYYLFRIKKYQQSLQNDLDLIKEAVEKGSQKWVLENLKIFQKHFEKSPNP